MPILPSRRFALLLAVAGTGFLVDPLVAGAFNAALLLAVAGDAAALFRRPAPVVRRSVAERIALDGAARVTVEIHNPDGARRRLIWTDDVPPTLKRAGPDTFEETIPAHRTVEPWYEVRGVERGRAALGDVHLRILGPLGLVWRCFRVRRRDETTVQPGLLDLRRHRVLALQDRVLPGSRRSRDPGEGREFERLREYVRGDDTRRIDWKATARHGRLIVREYEAERSQSIVLAVDAGRLMSERIAGRERLDHALAAALVLADAAAGRGDAVGVFLFADRVQAFLPPGRHGLDRIARVLGEVDARLVEPDYPAAFRYLGRQLRRRSLVVLFTDVVDPSVSAPLLAHVASAARRHLPLIVAIRNVELEAAATAPVSNEPDAFRRAAAEELLHARVVAFAAARRRGVLVADVPPSAAVPETLARYLEVKRRGLL